MSSQVEHQGDFFKDYDNKDSSLIVNAGVAQPPIMNPYVKKFYKKKPEILTVDQYMEGILAGNTTILSQAITLVESYLPEHRLVAQEIIKRCQVESAAHKTMRIGITGVPGAGIPGHFHCPFRAARQTGAGGPLGPQQAERSHPRGYRQYGRL